MKARRHSHTEDVEGIRTEIRVWVTRRGLTHSQLAARLGRAPSWVSKRIGTAPTVALTVDDLLELADVLDVPAPRPSGYAVD